MSLDTVSDRNQCSAVIQDKTYREQTARADEVNAKNLCLFQQSKPSHLSFSVNGHVWVSSTLPPDKMMDQASSLGYREAIVLSFSTSTKVRKSKKNDGKIKPRAAFSESQKDWAGTFHVKYVEPYVKQVCFTCWCLRIARLILLLV